MNNKEILTPGASAHDEDQIDLVELLFKILAHWKWITATAFIGVALAFTFNHFAPPSFQVNSTLIVKDNKSDGLNIANVFSDNPLKGDVSIDNQIEILRSFSLNHQALENLASDISWYKAMPIGDFNVYGREPYRVAFDKTAFNLKDVPVYIDPIDNEQYRITVDASTKILGIETEVDFEAKAKFNEPFENQYFSFTIQKTAPPEEGDFYFVFNDFDKQTLKNIDKLVVSRVNQNADLIKIEFTGDNSLQQLRYVNELSNVLIQYGLKQKNQISDNTIKFIDYQLKNIVDTLKSTSSQFTEYRSNKKVFDLGTEASLVAEKLSDLDSKRSVARMQLEYYSNLLSYISKDSDMKNMIFPSVVGITDQGLNSMIVRLSELNSKKEALSYSLHDKNPSVQIIERELEYIKKSLEENLNNLVFNTQKELESINNDIEQVNKQLSAYPKTEQDLINIKRMVDLNNELYNFLLQKRAEAQITKASNVPDVDILDPAREVTVTQTGPRKKINLLIGLFAGLFLPVCFILVKDFLNTSIQDQEQIERISSIPVLASIIHNNYKEALPVNEYPRSILTESFRELRTSLDYLNFESKKKVIGVHSMIPGEGKTFVSSNLAAILAMNQKKVIVVGADMRKPTLHNYFGASATPGLSTYLIGAHKLEDIIKQSQFNNLHFIPAGEIPPNPVELLNSERFSSLIDELKERYDIIIIDNSPMSLVTDGAVTNKVTDTNLFVVRQNYSPAKLLSLLQTLASKHNMKKVGIVINDVNPKRSSQYAYTYGGYYSNKSGYFSEK